jgi:DNA-binding response OmpR family regulator
VQEKILVVDDEQTIQDIITYALQKAGYLTVSAFDGEEALRLAREERPHLVVLDIMLPRLDGYEVCKLLSAEQSMPIIMLTAKDDEVDKIVGLEIGADDYLTKPFSAKELVARVRAHLRRSRKSAPQPSAGVITIGDFVINLDRREVFLGERKIELTPKEFDLVACLVQHRGKVLSREMLLDSVWGYEYYGDNRIVNVTVARIRDKLETDPATPQYIITVRGAGYLFQHPGERSACSGK